MSFTIGPLAGVGNNCQMNVIFLAVIDNSSNQREVHVGSGTILYVEAELHDVIGLHNVVFAFGANFAG